ncbi:Peptidase M48 [Dillenia turbinata]|uniref:Peptidase M48 n=1 Tax=Dillenia turbinata TaxID=194707 RepID=A0AAN8UCL2_9MAGN
MAASYSSLIVFYHLRSSRSLSHLSDCSIATHQLNFTSSSLRFRPSKKNRRARISVCRASSSSSAVVFRNLDADDFRYPLDKQNTLILRAIPGLNELGKAFLGTVAEQVMLLENIGTSVLVSKNQVMSDFRENIGHSVAVRIGLCLFTPGLISTSNYAVIATQLPELHQLMVEAAQILNIEAPDLYVRQSTVLNAHTLAISGKKPFVVVHTSLVELLTRKELQAVLAHELGHLKCDHGVWLTVANILTLGAYTIPGLGGMIAQSLEEQLFRWLRAAELTCDRAALLVSQDPKYAQLSNIILFHLTFHFSFLQEVVISVIMKLSGGCPSLADQLNVDAFLEQARSYEKASSSPLGWYIRNAQMKQLSHPLPVLRAREIDEWSRSQEYRFLLKRAMPVAPLEEV